MCPPRRCPTSLVSFGCCLLLAAASVQGHILPETIEARMFEDSSALNLVEAPALHHVHHPLSSDSETSKFSASEPYQPHPQPRQVNLDRMDSLSQSLSEPPSASEIIRSKRWKLQKITPPGRSRINNRSMTSFNEMESGELREEDEQEESARHADTALQVHRSSGDSSDYDMESRESGGGFMDIMARAARSTDIEEYFWKYVIDSDISASLEDDDDTNPEARFKKKKKFHLKHKYKKFLLPLLLAYKLKFMTLFPAMVGGLILLVKAAGLAGFFFALFASVVSLQKSH